jgi:hypothetical protein
MRGTASYQAHANLLGISANGGKVKPRTNTPFGRLLPIQAHRQSQLSRPKTQTPRCFVAVTPKPVRHYAKAVSPRHWCMGAGAELLGGTRISGSHGSPYGSQGLRPQPLDRSFPSPRRISCKSEKLSRLSFPVRHLCGFVSSSFHSTLTLLKRQTLMYPSPL